MNMTTSSAGRALIESFESLRLAAYLPTPHDVWTIGFGHTHEVREGDTCTAAEADHFIEEDLRCAELTIESCVSVELTQNEFDALVSLVFNIGPEAFRHSTLLRLLNLGHKDAAGTQFLMWDKQHSEVLPGLQRRREAESQLFRNPGGTVEGIAASRDPGRDPGMRDLIERTIVEDFAEQGPIWKAFEGWQAS